MVNNSIDDEEIKKFSDLANEWWDPHGKFKPLHDMNHLRVEYIQDFLYNYPKSKTILDIGCGGGLLSESLAKLDYKVTGIDPSSQNIKIAKEHAQNLEIDYQNVTIEEFSSLENNKFDIVLCMEVVEHVADLHSFIESCVSHLKDGGFLFLSTINRTLASYAQAIIGAEYILRWLPRGTHQWKKFVTPYEIRKCFDNNNVSLLQLHGMKYNFIYGDWQLSSNLSVNYLLVGQLFHI